MRTGKLAISRGSRFAEQRDDPPQLSLVPTAEDCGPPPAGSSDPADGRIRQRLELLERLARLHSLDLLTGEEFAAEKAALLGPFQSASPKLASSSPAASEQPPATGTSLLGHLFSWKFLPIGLVAGLALSFGAQPQETMRVFDQILRLAGV